MVYLVILLALGHLGELASESGAYGNAQRFIQWTVPSPPPSALMRPAVATLFIYVLGYYVPYNTIKKHYIVCQDYSAKLHNVLLWRECTFVTDKEYSHNLFNMPNRQSLFGIVVVLDVV